MRLTIIITRMERITNMKKDLVTKTLEIEIELYTIGTKRYAMINKELYIQADDVKAMLEEIKQ